MRITFLGHVALRIDRDGGPAVLMDPWFSRTGAFFRSWFQFPDNSFLRDESITGVGDIFISHNHADHFDPPVLKEALARNPDVKVHIAKFATSWFRTRIERELGELGDRLIEHPEFEEFETANGAIAFFVPEESPGQIDSAIVIRDDEHFFVNMNDARLNTAQLEKIAAKTDRIDWVTLQGSGASEYPINYLYDPADMESRKLEKRRLKLAHCERVIDIFDPHRLVFCAGPPVFLDPELAAHNDMSEASVFPDQLDIVRHFESERTDIVERTLFLIPGLEFSDDYLWTNTPADSPHLIPFTDKARYIEGYRKDRQDVLDFARGELPDHEAMLAHFSAMAHMSDYVAARIGGKLAFVIEGDDEKTSFTVDFDKQESAPGCDEDVLYVLTAPASALNEVLAGNATWDDIFLSIRMTFDERTDRFISHFKTLLKYMDRDMMAALEKYELGITVDSELADFEWNGKTYRRRRYCPHAGVDLVRQGRINDDGTITCMAHRFCFDLESGRCTNVEGFSLKPE